MKNLSIKANTFFHCLKYKVFGTPAPVLLSLAVTNRCNLKCPFCYANVFNRQIGDLSTDALLDIMKEFFDLGTQGIMLQGGEPLLREDIEILIRYIKDNGRFCSMTTNGTLIARNIDKLASVDRLEVSFDGSREMVTRSRGRDIYDQLLEGFRMLDEHGVTFCIHCVVNNETTIDNEILPILRLAKQYGTYATFCSVSGTSEDVETNKIGLELDVDHIRRIYEGLIDLKKSGHPVGNSLNVLRHVTKWPFHMSRIVFSNEEDAAVIDAPKCLYGRLSVYMDADGTLYPCAKSFHREGFGENIFEAGGVRGAWERLSKLECMYCGESAEGTYLFSLTHMEDLVNAAKY